MEYLPKKLAAYFHLYADTSSIKVIASIFGGLVLIMALSAIHDFVAMFIAPLLFALIFIAVLGIASARHYSREQFYTTHPMLLYLTTSKVFNRVAPIVSRLSHLLFIAFVNLFAVGAVFIAISLLVSLW